jgi:hypothetical protein
LPTEFVSEIFIHFLPIYPSCPPLTGLLSPNILLGICRKWREIALTIPALWRAIPLDYLPDNLRQQIQTVKAWLSRSGCNPLSIQAEEYVSTKTELLAAVVPHCARWEHVKHIDLSDLLPIEHLMPMLRQLDIVVPSTVFHPFLSHFIKYRFCGQPLSGIFLISPPF